MVQMIAAFKLQEYPGPWEIIMQKNLWYLISSLFEDLGEWFLQWKQKPPKFLYFAMYNVDFTHIFEGKIRMCIIYR